MSKKYQTDEGIEEKAPVREEDIDDELTREAITEPKAATKKERAMNKTYLISPLPSRYLTIVKRPETNMPYMIKQTI